MGTGMDKGGRVSGETTLAEGRFVALRKLTWIDQGGVEREWESAERIGFSGAVLVVPLLVPSRRLLLIRQYRPPVGASVIEFPAGLVNHGEDPADAARRELREETGYVAGKTTVFPAAYTTPGLSDESVFMVHAEIDETTPENRKPQTEFDPGESIETLVVPADDLADFYARETAVGSLFDAKLAAYAMAKNGF